MSFFFYEQLNTLRNTESRTDRQRSVTRNYIQRFKIYFLREECLHVVNIKFSGEDVYGESPEMCSLFFVFFKNQTTMEWTVIRVPNHTSCEEEMEIIGKIIYAYIQYQELPLGICRASLLHYIKFGIAVVIL